MPPHQFSYIVLLASLHLQVFNDRILLYELALEGLHLYAIMLHLQVQINGSFLRYRTLLLLRRGLLLACAT
jgi:hypothetical protein